MFGNFSISGVSQFVTSAATIDHGGSFTITCDYSKFSTGSPTVAWYRNDQMFTDSITQPSSTRSLFTVETADENNNGVYQCKVTYDTHGTAISPTVTQYVRYLTPSANIFGVLGKNIDVTCTFYGDTLGPVTWLKDPSSTPLETGGQYTLIAGTYTNQMRKDTLRISTLEAGNAGAYSCKASYTASNKEVTSTQTLAVTDVALSVTVTRNPTDSLVDKDTSVALTCVYTVKQLQANEGTMQTAWTLNDKPLDSKIVIDKNTAGTETFQVTVGSGDQVGKYKCTVTYGVFGSISGESVVLMQTVQHSATVYAMNAAPVSLTCVAFGNEPVAITWNDGTRDLTNTNPEVTDGAYENYKVESMFAISAATSSKSYVCKVKYSDTVTITETTALKVLNAVGKQFILFQMFCQDFLKTSIIVILPAVLYLNFISPIFIAPYNCQIRSLSCL